MWPKLLHHRLAVHRVLLQLSHPLQHAMAASIQSARHIMALPSHIRTLAMRHILAASMPPATFTRLSPTPHRNYATYNTNASAASSSSSNNSSVNQTEVSHFNTLASSWWDPHGSSRLLHLMNPLRHDFIKECLGSAYAPSSSTQKLNFLDIGCGGGIFAESAARLKIAEKVVGIDPTPMCIQVARGHARRDPALLGGGKLEYKNIAIEELAVPVREEDKFDVVSLFEVIEHIQNPSPFLRNVLRHLKPGGWLVGSTIARTGTSWFTTKFVAEEVLRMVPRGTHEWKQYINPGELREWARDQEELDVVVGGQGWRQKGVVYVPGVGWKVVDGSEDWGNYFFGMRKVDGKDDV